jgi:hypothetical protein
LFRPTGGGLMKFLYIILFTMVILSGSQSENYFLDPSKLEKVEVKGNVTEEQLKEKPISYKAPSEETGLEALQFEMKLSKKLPFELSSFLPPDIEILNTMERK